MNSYLNRLYTEFMFRHSIAEMLLWGFVLTAFWLACALWIAESKRGQTLWAWINRLLFVSCVVYILWYTVLNRSGGIREICLIPFYTFVFAREDPSRYRSAVANVLLFVPFGLSLPFVLWRPLIPGRSGARHPVRTTLIAAAVFSAMIEAAQMVFQLGYSETDDVIFNTAGAALGALAYAGYARLSDKAA